MKEPDGGITRRPIAHLLTDEMRARVAAATFERMGLLVRARTGPGGFPVCPLGVALGMSRSPSNDEAFRGFGVDAGQPASNAHFRVALREFMYDADSGEIRPEDVKPMLGVIP